MRAVSSCDDCVASIDEEVSGKAGLIRTTHEGIGGRSNQTFQRRPNHPRVQNGKGRSFDAKESVPAPLWVGYAGEG
ncbi:MAG TPA: hypothetical protein VJV79_20380 [Polyangiaceae bacterium]|nr:hypothetical protein [Polyangiaceae bacterium]